MSTILHFQTREEYFCQWENGAKEYFETMKEAVARVAEHDSNKKRSEYDNNYWARQKFIIGKRVVITQQLNVLTPVDAAIELIDSLESTREKN